MIKTMSFFKRRRGMDVESFQARWRNAHAAVVLRLPGIRRYVQSHPPTAGYRRGELVFDGIASVWFEDMAALRASSASSEYAALKEDEAAFIDPDSMTMLIVEEAVVKDTPVPEGAIKYFGFLNRKPGMTPEAFQRYWRETHGRIASENPYLLRYVQNHVRLSAYGRPVPPRFDGVPEAWFADLDAARASGASPELARTRADEANFLPDTPRPAMVAREIVIL